MSLKENIKEHAKEIGFDLAGIAGAGSIQADHIEYLREWLDAGKAGGMEYLHRNFEKRTNPGLLMDGAKSIICVAINYKPFLDCELLNVDCGLKIARYAWYEDYHEFIKHKLDELAAFIKKVHGDFKFKICVDSVPLAERSVAEAAGLGFIGKNHMLINPALGAELLLGEMITDLELEADKPIAKGCSNCNACIAACPTGALSGKGDFDARKCISYLTIECKDEFGNEKRGQARLGVPRLCQSPFFKDEESWAGCPCHKIGKRVFGCDECMLACPYARCAPCGTNKEFRRWLNNGYLDGRKILAMTPEEFDRRFKNTAIHRTGPARMQRNVRICMRNAK